MNCNEKTYKCNLKETPSRSSTKHTKTKFLKKLELQMLAMSIIEGLWPQDISKIQVIVYGLNNQWE